MPAKKAVLYAKAPEPADGSKKWIVCKVCGTNREYHLLDILRHWEWCALAKEEAELVAAQNQQQQNMGPSHR